MNFKFDGLKFSRLQRQNCISNTYRDHRRSKTSTKSRVHTWVKLDHAVDCSSQPLIGDVIASQRVSRPAVDIKF